MGSLPPLSSLPVPAWLTFQRAAADTHCMTGVPSILPPPLAHRPLGTVRNPGRQAPWGLEPEPRAESSGHSGSSFHKCPQALGQAVLPSQDSERTGAAPARGSSRTRSHSSLLTCSFFLFQLPWDLRLPRCARGVGEVSFVRLLAEYHLAFLWFQRLRGLGLCSGCRQLPAFPPPSAFSRRFLGPRLASDLRCWPSRGPDGPSGVEVGAYSEEPSCRECGGPLLPSEQKASRSIYVFASVPSRIPQRRWGQRVE